MAYAVLTGLSPSVCRAVLMFSFFVFKDAVKRETNVYNVLAASAIILLTIQPLWLFNVGFQLSYLAVFSIVFLQKHIKNWFVFTDCCPNNYFSIVFVLFSSISQFVFYFKLNRHSPYFYSAFISGLFAFVCIL
jgi:ComEC/Rec2-related protein